MLGEAIDPPDSVAERQPQEVLIKAELKVYLILLLGKHAYPLVDRDEICEEIFEQAENFKKYQGA